MTDRAGNGGIVALAAIVALGGALVLWWKSQQRGAGGGRAVIPAGGLPNPDRETTGEKIGARLAGVLGFVNFPTHYDAAIITAANATGISPKVLKSVLISESSLNPKATGAAGELGIAQFMPATWAEESRKFWGETLPPEAAYDPYKAIPVAANYIAWLLRQTRGEYAAALAAYNGGIGNYKRGTLPKVSWQYARKILRRAGLDSRLPDGV